jgi:hypothetical protein
MEDKIFYALVDLMPWLVVGGAAFMALVTIIINEFPKKRK